MATKIKKKTLLTPIIRTVARRIIPEPTTTIADVPADDNSLRDAEITNLKTDVKNLFQMITVLSKSLDAIHPPDQSARDAIQSIKSELNNFALFPKP